MIDFEGFKRFNEAKTDRINLQGVLPNIIDPNKIQANISALERACNLAGINRLEGNNLSQQPTTGFRVTTVGLVGNNAAGFPSRNQEDLFQVNSTYSPSTGFVGTILLNSREIGQQIAKRREWRQSYYSVEGWAYYMDLILRCALQDLANSRWKSELYRPDRPLRTWEFLNVEKPQLVVPTTL